MQNTYYFDNDGDGYGGTEQTTLACSAPEGFVENHSDCNDHNGEIHPDAEEICYDQIDNNCNGQRDENCPTCNQDLDLPVLEFNGAEPIYENDIQYTAYYLTVANRAIYPDEMFVSSRDYPCGEEDIGSRMVVELYDGNNHLLRVYCNLESQDDMQGLYFITYPGDPIPETVYIDIIDQECDLTFRSDLVSIGETEPGVVYDNGGTLWDGAMSIVTRIVADDFSLSRDSRLTAASVDLWYNARTFDNFGTINWWIFDDANGLPGRIVAQGSGTNYSPTYIRQASSGNTHFWTLDFNLEHDVILAAERRYWFGIRALTLNQEILVYWSNVAANENTGYNDASSENGTPDNWRQDSSPVRNRAFRLIGY